MSTLRLALTGPGLAGSRACTATGTGADTVAITLSVDVSVSAPAADAGCVRAAQGAVHRVRVGLLLPGSGRPVVDRHLRVRTPAPRPWPRLADVLAVPGADAAAAGDVAGRHPGAAVVAVYRDGERCGLRLGGPYGSGGALLSLGAGRAAGICWETWASLAHAWLVAGLSVAGLASAAVRVIRRPVPWGQSGAVSPSIASRSRTAAAGPGRSTDR
ncbi:transcriptional regulator [Streptomyces sp. NPDC058989]|uniref:transcriptional regulator n=1 Tax=Streptomyces sp. NPDC058989 TaxID=3346686 RepID=UPI003687A673